MATSNLTARAKMNTVIYTYIREYMYIIYRRRYVYIVEEEYVYVYKIIRQSHQRNPNINQDSPGDTRRHKPRDTRIAQEIPGEHRTTQESQRPLRVHLNWQARPQHKHTGLQPLCNHLKVFKRLPLRFHPSQQARWENDTGLKPLCNRLRGYEG